jgi:transcriptional regulator with XRE-family HTH domain
MMASHFPGNMSRQHISELRKLRKLSQAALGKEAGLTASEISRIECGYRDMSDREAINIAKALGVLPAKVDPRLLKAAQPVGLAASGAKTDVPGISQNHGDLANDPANFREMPDEAIFAETQTNSSEQMTRLTELAKRAVQILHTPKVPAAIRALDSSFSANL